MALIDRIKNMILTPAQEWQVVAGETPTGGSLYTGYVMIVAAIGPIVTILLGQGVTLALVGYAFGLGVIYVLALIIDFLAPHFGGEKSIVRALQLVAYSATAAWVGSILQIIPFIGGILSIAAGLYSLYVFYLGAPVLRKCTPDKAVVLTVLYVLLAIVLMMVVGSLLFALVLGGTAGMMGMAR